jgi:hypothetical protein
MAVVVDDHVLLDLLTDNLPQWLARAVRQEAVYTTSSWYYRLASASEHGSGTGALSGRVALLPERPRAEVRAAILELPIEIGLISTRVLVPVMASLRSPRRLNYLSAEALAVAVLTEARVAVRTDSPPLRQACEAFHVDYRLVDAS